MPKYQYIARDSDQTERSGSIDAVDFEAARAELQNSGLTLVELRLPTADRPPKLTSAEALELTTQVAEMAKAGLPLATGLRAMQADLPSGRLSRAVDLLVSSIEAGTPVDIALSRAAAWLPAHLRGMLAAGVHSGRLAEVLQESLTYEQLQAESRRRMSWLIAYPMVVFTVFLGWSAFVLLVLVPNFTEIFYDFGIRLPLSTQILVWMSGPGKWLLLVPLAAIDVAPLVLQACSHTFVASWLLAHLPLFGPAWRARSMVGFCNLLATLLDQSIPLPAALRLTADGLGDGQLRAACRDLALQTAAGRSLSQSAATRSAIPHTLVPIIRWGEENSALSEALRSAADLYMNRMEVQLEILSLVFPPLTFLFVAVATLWVIGAMILPLINLVGALSS
jgi:type IV pilus assembly protein PilC